MKKKFLYQIIKVIVFVLVFFGCIRPLNSIFLDLYMVPSLNDYYHEEKNIQFDFINDNLIIYIDKSEYYLSLPFDAFYIFFIIIIFPKIFSIKFIYYHALNFLPLILIPFINYSLITESDIGFKIFNFSIAISRFIYSFKIILVSAENFKIKLF